MNTTGKSIEIGWNDHTRVDSRWCHSCGRTNVPSAHHTPATATSREENAQPAS